MNDFLVVGGGVIGLSLAWELSRRGKSVCLVDRDTPGKATSWIGAGIFPPPRTAAKHDPMEVLRSASHSLHVDWSERLRDETGLDNGLVRCGGVYFARKVGESVALNVEMKQAANDGVTVEDLSSEELAKVEPALADVATESTARYLLPDEMQLRSPLHLQALIAACQKNGVEIRSHSEVNGLKLQGDKIAGVLANGETLVAREYCLCCGPWAAKLLEPIGENLLPVEPWRGQLLLWKTDKPLVSRVINEGLRYLVPRRDGHLLVGATLEDVGFDLGTTEVSIAELRSYSRDLLPALAEENFVNAWAGLRPKTPDGSPYMGRVPGFQNLSVSAGHFRSGLHLSPISAVFMAELLLEDTPSIDPTPFRVNR